MTTPTQLIINDDNTTSERIILMRKKKEIVVNLFNELLNVFETSNKIIYDQLIRIRHKIRNVYSARDIQRYFDKNAVALRDKITTRNHKLFDDDYLICDWIWNDTNDYNKEVIWTWIEKIYDAYAS